MAGKPFYTDLDLKQVSQLVQAKFQALASDPAGAVEGQEWLDSTNNLRKVILGSSVETYAMRSWVLEQINLLGRSQGGFDANPGALPVPGDKTVGDTSNMQVGDAWYISNGGTITGILGADELDVGDKLQYMGGDPTVASNWIGIQRNLDDALISDVKTDTQTVSLVANTPLVVSSSVIAQIKSVQVYDSSGNEIEVCIVKTANANERSIESTASLTNVVVELLGNAV